MRFAVESEGLVFGSAGTDKTTAQVQTRIGKARNLPHSRRAGVGRSRRNAGAMLSKFTDKLCCRTQSAPRHHQGSLQGSHSLSSRAQSSAALARQEQVEGALPLHQADRLQLLSRFLTRNLKKSLWPAKTPQLPPGRRSRRSATRCAPVQSGIAALQIPKNSQRRQRHHRRVRQPVYRIGEQDVW